ncbi:peroxiredoxin family protein [Paraburkholderia sp. BCC1885]|uniref:peroxiredoxin family protein n=1 Tax=Paraburkholderia sp. BCC1885 TaxID=2562669 RepID=UPI0016425413|nr:peroxiredoxin family protein [Paraburkholderia sp. BCC1885]
MTLEETLSQLREKFGKMLPPEPAAVMDGHIGLLRESGAVSQILKTGAPAPPFTVKNQNGEDVSSLDLLTRGPLVVSFTRGGWCPYCAAEVRALNDLYDQYQQAGVELVVLSPQSADRAKKQAADDKLKFNLLVDDASVWQLPIPARFVIDTSGAIRDAKADPDYRYRPDPSETLAVAKSLGLRNP